MDKRYTKRAVSNSDLIEILDPDGDILTSATADIADQLLSHLNASGGVYHIFSGQGHLPGQPQPLPFYEVVDAADRTVVLLRTDNLMEAAIVLSHLEA